MCLCPLQHSQGSAGGCLHSFPALLPLQGPPEPDHQIYIPNPLPPLLLGSTTWRLTGAYGEQEKCGFSWSWPVAATLKQGCLSSSFTSQFCLFPEAAAPVRQLSFTPPPPSELFPLSALKVRLCQGPLCLVSSVSKILLWHWVQSNWDQHWSTLINKVPLLFLRLPRIQCCTTPWKLTKGAYRYRS